MVDNFFAGCMEGEVPYEELQEKSDRGEIHRWNFEPFDFQENGYEDVLDDIKKYRSSDAKHTI